MAMIEMHAGRIFRSLVRVFIILAVAFCAPLALSQTLVPAAQTAMEHGLAAAQQQEWKLAIRYFLDAQRIDPDATQIWFNLGLASSKLPDQEFRAIAWFRAYLLANPSAGNAVAVRSQLERLEVGFESRLGKVIDALEPVAKVIIENQMVVSLGSKPIADTPASRKRLRMPSYVSSGGLLAAMRLYLGDKAGAERTRRNFGIESGKVPIGCDIDVCAPVPAHLDRALASAGLYDELVADKKWTSLDSSGKELVAANRVLFAFERGDVDTAEKMDVFQGWGCRTYCACKFYDLGRFDEAKSAARLSGREEAEAAFKASPANWFVSTCSGWWLKKGDVPALLARGRDGQAIAVKDNDKKIIGQFDDVSIGEYLYALKQHLTALKKAQYGRLSTYDITDSLMSLADLFESYRQMRGPYDR
jgi:tetratricopeptide (TPR) repeat protein